VLCHLVRQRVSVQHRRPVLDAEVGLESLGGPAEHALDDAQIDAVIAEAIADMERLGITGKDATPFLLARVAERTGGRSLRANIELVTNNARLAAAVAKAL